MHIDLTIANQDAAGRNYLTWAPVKSTVRLLDVDGADPVNVTLSNDNPQAGGHLQAVANLPHSTPEGELTWRNRASTSSR